LRPAEQDRIEAPEQARPRDMKFVTTLSDLSAERERLRRAGRSVAFVPTMGALHEGHLSLVRLAAKSESTVVVSIFVNPTQFAPNEDFTRYPRDVERDRALLEKEPVDLLFAPAPEEIYPKGFRSTVHIAELTETMEGAVRPGHFDGVATVVARLFGLVRPDVAVFGRKDGQQCAVIARLVEDLAIPVRLLFGETVREKDGLALSSRNAYLSPGDRRRAPALYRGLSAGLEAWRRGALEAEQITQTARAAAPEIAASEWDYLVVADAGTMQPVASVERAAMLAGAVRLGDTRLIDNVILEA
jgi:pantoate--beta-alanine ligase